jgi:hypothetical protein
MTNIRTASRRLLSAALLSAAVTLGGATHGFLPVAGAAPNWDIENYDDCLNDIDTNNSVEIIIELIKYCCDHSGGVWQGEQGHTVGQMCAAPAAMGGDGAQPTSPWVPKSPIDLVPVKPPTLGTPPPPAATLTPAVRNRA